MNSSPRVEERSGLGRVPCGVGCRVRSEPLEADFNAPLDEKEARRRAHDAHCRIIAVYGLSNTSR